jgi:hypothetical protein
LTPCPKRRIEGGAKAYPGSPVVDGMGESRTGITTLRIREMRQDVAGRLSTISGVTAAKPQNGHISAEALGAGKLSAADDE